MSSHIDDNGPARLREIAFHESAHAIAAEKLLGDAPRISITRRANDRGGWTLTGDCTVAVPANIDAAIAVALAGATAQTLATDGMHASGGPLLYAILRRVSASDHKLMGNAAISRGDVERSIQAVRSWWPEIEARAALETARFHGAAVPAAATGRPAIAAAVPAAGSRIMHLIPIFD